MLLAKQQPQRLSKKEIVSPEMRRVMRSRFMGMRRPRFPDTRRLIERIQSWVYVAMDRNATELSRGVVRLFKANGKSQTTAKIRRIDVKTLLHLKAVNRLASEEAVEIIDHPVLDVLANPTPILDGCSFMWLTMAYLQLFGEAFIIKGRNELGEVRELWPLPNQWVVPILGPENVIDAYEFRAGATMETWAAEDVIHIRKPSPIDMVSALGPLKGILQAAETNLRFSEWQNAFFQNFAVPDTLLIPTEDVSQDQVEQLITEWESNFGGWRRRGKTGVMPFKLEVERLGMSMKEMQSKDQADMLKNEILSGFGVPPQVITTDGATFNNLRQGLQLWQRNTIGSYQVTIITALNRQLLSEWVTAKAFVQPQAFLAFDNPVSEDRETDTELRITRVRGGLVTVNAARAEEGADPVAGGDDLKIEAGLVNVSDPTQAEIAVQTIENQTAMQQATIAAEQARAQLVADTPLPEAVSEDVAVSFAELTQAATALSRLGDLDGLNAIRSEIASRIGQTLAPLTSIQAAAFSAIVNDEERNTLQGVSQEARETTLETAQRIRDESVEVQQGVSAGGGQANQELAQEMKMVKVSNEQDSEGPSEDGQEKPEAEGDQEPKPTKDADDRDDKSLDVAEVGSRPPRRDMRGYDPANPDVYPNALLRAVCELDTKLYLIEVDQPEESFESGLQGVFSEMKNQILENLARSDKAVHPKVTVGLFDIDEWIARFTSVSEPFIQDALAKGVAAGQDDLRQFGALAAFDDPMSVLLSPDELQSAVLRETDGFASAVVDVTGRELGISLNAGLQEGENVQQLAKRIEALYEEKNDVASKRIARTEINNAANAGAVESWQKAGVQKYEWLASADACEFCLAMDGKVIQLGKAFAELGADVKGVEGGLFPVKYKTVKHPPLHPNDRCTIVPIIEGLS